MPLLVIVQTFQHREESNVLSVCVLKSLGVCEWESEREVSLRPQTRQEQLPLKLGTAITLPAILLLYRLRGAY